MKRAARATFDATFAVTLSSNGLPNIITPNGDGLNDRFVVKGLARGPWALTLYNRWGREVYATVDYGHDWGGDAPAGVYYYLLWQGRARYKGTLEVLP